MKKLFILLALLCSGILTKTSLAQSITPAALVQPDSLRMRLDYVFGRIDKSQVSTGILEEYSYDFLPLDVFQGTLTDSNKVDMRVWRMIYATLYSGRIYGTNTLDPLSAVNSNIKDIQSSAIAIPVPMISMDYNYLRPDAINANLFTVQNDQLADVPGRPYSPYYTRPVFAAAPAVNYSNTGDVSFIFRQDLYYTNNNKTVSSIAVDFADGRGYVAAGWNEPVSASYLSTGIKLLKFKLSYTDGSSDQCYSELNVSKVAGVAARYASPANTTQTFLPAADHSGGTAYVRYSVNSGGKIAKPLIVAKGYDISSIAPDLQSNYSFENFIDDINSTGSYDFNYALDNLGSYDLIFLDYNNGTDDLRRNAALLQEVINWVNLQKAASGSTQQNVVMGISMGGLVARYALANMTKSNIDPQTRLLITHDSPHRGANTPLGIQWLAQGINSISLGFISAADIIPQIGEAALVLDAPATQQLLILRGTGFGSFANNVFLDHEYRNMITFNAVDPQPAYRIVATSLGSECGTGSLSPYTQLANINGNFFLSPIPWIFRNNFKAQITINALPDFGQSRQIDYIRFWSNYRILSLININTTIFSVSANSPANTLPWDGAPGGTQNIASQAGGQFPTVHFKFLWFLQANLSSSFAGDFCFVPTVSALDIASISSSSLSAHYVGGISPGNISRTSNFIAQEQFSSGGQSYYNQTHPIFTPRNAEWIYDEMQGIGNTLNCSSACQPNNVTISGDFPPNSCVGTVATFSIPEFGGTATYNWSVTPNMQITGGQGTTVATIKVLGGGSGTINLGVSTDCGTTNVPGKNMRAGGYSSSDYPVTGPSSSCPNQTVYFSTNTLPGATNYNWFWPTDWNYISGQGTPNLTLRTSSNSGMVGVRVANNCDQGGSPGTKYVQVLNCGMSQYVIFPNPASNQLNIAIKGQSALKSNAIPGNNLIYEISLFDKFGSLIQNFKYPAGISGVSLNLANVKDGLYILQIDNGKEKSSSEVIVQH